MAVTYTLGIPSGNGVAVMFGVWVAGTRVGCRATVADPATAVTEGIALVSGATVIGIGEAGISTVGKSVGSGISCGPGVNGTTTMGVIEISVGDGIGVGDGEVHAASIENDVTSTSAPRVKMDG